MTGGSSGRLSGQVFVRVGMFLALTTVFLQRIASETVPVSHPEPDTTVDYVGSRACAKCHQDIYDSYSRTDMGRSMSVPAGRVVEKAENPILITDPASKRQFDVFVRDGQLYQSEFEKRGDGKDIFRDTHKVEWILGSGANGFGAILERDDYLFEAPLSFYSKIDSWALSPGYEFANYGFSRPILPGCIACHSGQPRAIPSGNGRFMEPPFAELAIGCENCHGPGQAHVAEMIMSGPTGTGSRTIVNPAKLSVWLSNNICMSCHQTGDARVLKPGKSYRDFRPGTPLDHILAILMVPPSRQNPLQSDLLEHYFSMTLSKCYRKSGGKLACTSCHNPHVQPSAEEAPAYFRAKCLACHSEKSCAVPVTLRQRRSPPDDCAGCHMPKREVKVISHSALTNHRIVAGSDESFPDVSSSTEVADLIHLNAVPGEKESVSPLALLEAYGQITASHPEYRQRYWDLAKQLEISDPDSVVVLEALADWATQQKTVEGEKSAIRYLDKAIHSGASNPADYEELARLLIVSGRNSEAVPVLQKGLQVMPYDAEFYRALGNTFVTLKKTSEAVEILKQGNRIFPQDPIISDLLKRLQGSE